MRKTSKLLALLVVLAMAVAVFAIAGCSSTTPTTTTGTTPATPATTTATSGSVISTAGVNLVTPGQITVGSDTTFPPFESMNGKVAEGFDVDMMNAIGQQLGLKVVFQTENFDTMFASLAGHKFDVIASASSIKPDRVKILAYSAPYFDSNQSIAVLKSSGITTITQLAGKKIGVQAGTTGEAWATQNLKPKGATIVPFQDTTGAFNALQAGTVDAVVNDLPVTAEIIKEGPTRGFTIMAKVGTAEQYVIWVAKDNPQLLTAIDAALAKIKADGTLQKINDKWITTGQ
jgi:polar amino acid transport system substrate-binding protein